MFKRRIITPSEWERMKRKATEAEDAYNKKETLENRFYKPKPQGSSQYPVQDIQSGSLITKRSSFKMK